MLESLAKEFLSSSVAGDAVASLKSEAGLDDAQATNALSATAEGAVGALAGGGGLGDMVGGLLGGGGGAAGMLGGLLGGGGGGAAGVLGGLLGGGGGGGAAGMLGGMLGGGASTGLPPAVTDTIVNFVAEKTGLGADKARLAVNVVLPKIVAFAKSKLG